MGKIVAFVYKDEILEGCKINMRISDEESLTSIVAECVKRLLTILEQLHLNNLVKIVKNKQFKLEANMEDILEGEDEVFSITSQS